MIAVAWLNCIFWHVFGFVMMRFTPIPDKWKYYLSHRAWYSMYGIESGMSRADSWKEWNQLYPKIEEARKE